MAPDTSTAGTPPRAARPPTAPCLPAFAGRCAPWHQKQAAARSLRVRVQTARTRSQNHPSHSEFTPDLALSMIQKRSTIGTKSTAVQLQGLIIMKSISADIGLVGLAVMGQNLALNIADHGYTIAVYNRNPEKMQEFIAYCEKNEPSCSRVIGFEAMADFVGSIKRPRKIVLLVKAGEATDATIEALIPHMEAGDIVIDGGNALWTDTI